MHGKHALSRPMVRQGNLYLSGSRTWTDIFLTLAMSFISSVPVLLLKLYIFSSVYKSYSNIILLVLEEQLLYSYCVWSWYCRFLPQLHGAHRQRLRLLENSIIGHANVTELSQTMHTYFSILYLWDSNLPSLFRLRLYALYFCRGQGRWGASYFLSLVHQYMVTPENIWRNTESNCMDSSVTKEQKVRYVYHNMFRID